MTWLYCITITHHNSLSVFFSFLFSPDQMFWGVSQLLLRTPSDCNYFLVLVFADVVLVRRLRLKLKCRSWRRELQMHSLLGREKKEEEAGFGIDLTLSPGFLPQAATMFSCVGCFWVLLSSVLVAVCSFSFISPAWIVKDQLRSNQHHHQHNNKDSVSFGLLWHCSESLDHMYRCYTFGGLGKFAEIPSSSWQVVTYTHPWPSHVDGWEHEGHQVGRARYGTEWKKQPKRNANIQTYYQSKQEDCISLII